MLILEMVLAVSSVVMMLKSLEIVGKQGDSSSTSLGLAAASLTAAFGLGILISVGTSIKADLFAGEVREVICASPQDGGYGALLKKPNGSLEFRYLKSVPSTKNFVAGSGAWEYKSYP